MSADKAMSMAQNPPNDPPKQEPWSQEDIDNEVFLNSEEDDEGDLMDEMADMMCSLDRHGQCGQAGSEYCEFECPYRNERD